MTDRIKIINLELNVSLACNLKCEYCSHFGRYMQGIVSLDELSFWYKSWNSKILPDNIVILGGEPLLHPEIGEILRMTRNDWANSSVELVTNALLIPKMKAPFFSAIRENGIHVSISRHIDDPEYNRLIQTGIDLLRSHGIEPNTRQSDLSWKKYYRLIGLGQAAPYQSDPEKAWQNCFVRGNCITLLDNQLYRCPQLACAAHGRKKGFLSADWDIVLDYQPLSHQCTRAELEEFVRHEACPQCAICPETFEYADMYQKLNVFGLPQIRKFFCGGNGQEPS